MPYALIQSILLWVLALFSTQDPAPSTAPATPPILRALHPESGCVIVAHSQIGRDLSSVSIFPPDPKTVVDYYTLPEIQRECWGYSLRLGHLHLRVSLYQDKNAQHLEGSVLVMNSESLTPVGFVQPDWLGLVVRDGDASFVPRYGRPYGIEPSFVPGHVLTSIWRLTAAESWGIRGGNMLPFVFSLTYGSPFDLLTVDPMPVRVKGGGLIPYPQITTEVAATMRTQEEERWYEFQTTDLPGSVPPMFGYSRYAGTSGDQKRLGKHPLLSVNHPLVASSFGADRARGEIYWVEGHRQYWYDDIPTVPMNRPEAVYFMDGIHWTSRWQAGYLNRGSEPYKGPTYDITGYNLEHFRSTLPEIAMATQDPGLMYMTAQLGKVLQGAVGLYGINEGGFFGGAFSNMRGWLRPVAEMMEVIVALKSHGDRYASDVARLEAHLRAVLLRWASRPDWARFSTDPARLDGYVPGYIGQNVTECWQAGIGGDYLWAWWLYTGDQSARYLASQLQLVHIQGWQGETARDIAMPKNVLASDWTIGGPYHRRFDGLTAWNYTLMSIKEIWPEFERRRAMIEEAILMEYPTANQGKWGSGPWENWNPGVGSAR